MEKAINTKTKKINVIYGFFGDINYGVDYPTLTDNIELVDLLPYLNKGKVEITENGLSSVLFSACSELKGSAWENRENRKYKLFMEVRTLKYEPTIDVCFRIVENAA